MMAMDIEELRAYIVEKDEINEFLKMDVINGLQYQKA